MEQLVNGYTLSLPEGSFPLSTDSMVLAHFVRLPREARVLDLGSGCGTLGVLLCAGDDACHVTGIEIDPDSHAAAKENIQRNALDTRMEAICADLRRIPTLLPPGGFSCCVSNPPYFSGGAVSKRQAVARSEAMCSLTELMKAAQWGLKYGGDFYLVHRPERLGEIIAQAASCRMEAKRLCLVRHDPDRDISLILLQLRKGGKPGLKLEEIVLYHSDGTPTEVCREIYHI